MSSFAALLPSKWVGGHRSELAAIGLMAASTVSMLRNAQPPYLNDAVGALRAGSSFAAAGNRCVMATLGWREGYAYVTGGGGDSAAAAGPAKGGEAAGAPARASSRASILARAAGGAGLAVAVAGLGTALAGAHQQSEKRINSFLTKTNDQKAGEFGDEVFLLLFFFRLVSFILFFRILSQPSNSKKLSAQ